MLIVCWRTFLKAGSAVESSQYTSTKAFQHRVPVRADFVRISYETRMWANAQPDGRPAEHRWRPLFHAAKFG